MRSLLALLALLGLAAPALAQTPDTTTAARYLPLAVGNEWHYDREETRTNTPNVSVQTRHVVLDESSPGRFTVETTARRVVGSGAPSVTTQQRTWYVDPVTTQAVADGLPTSWCPLNSPWAGSTCAQILGGYGRDAVVAPDTLVTTVKVHVRNINLGNGYSGTGYEYAAGLGLRFHQTNFVDANAGTTGVTNVWLRYARISGQTYGVRLAAFTVGTEASAASDAALTVGPNPTAGSAVLRYALAAPGPVRLVVADALGREVAVVVDAERAAATHTDTFDATRLAPGVYVARLTAGRASATARLIVTR